MYLDEILLHVSRGVRWDSDHVVMLSDELQAIAQELVRGDYLGRVHIGLDFFDASINRVAAWVIGTRSMHQGALARLARADRDAAPARGRGRHDRAAGAPRRAEIAARGVRSGTITAARTEFPPAADWLAEVKAYERDVLSKRG